MPARMEFLAVYDMVHFYKEKSPKAYQEFNFQEHKMDLTQLELIAISKRIGD